MNTQKARPLADITFRRPPIGRMHDLMLLTIRGINSHQKQQARKPNCRVKIKEREILISYHKKFSSYFQHLQM